MKRKGVSKVARLPEAHRLPSKALLVLREPVSSWIASLGLALALSEVCPQVGTR